MVPHEGGDLPAVASQGREAFSRERAKTDQAGVISAVPPPDPDGELRHRTASQDGMDRSPGDFTATVRHKLDILSE